MAKYVVPKEGQDRLVWWPVKVRIPKDHGRYEIFDFKAQFKLLKKAELDALASTDNVDLWREVFVGWNDHVIDDSGAPMPFSEEVRDLLIEPIFFRTALQTAYNEANKGGK